MEWNNGKERAKFKREQLRLKEQYESVGMTATQIQAMYDTDKRIFDCNRREAEHTQKLDFSMFDDDITDDGQNPLTEKFGGRLTTELDLSCVSRYAWIEEIENESLAKALKRLSAEDIEFLTLYVIERYTQDELAVMYGIHKSNISRRFSRIKKFLIEFIAKAQQKCGSVGYHLRGDRNENA